MDNNQEATHLDLPVQRKEINPVDTTIQNIRKSIEPNNKKQNDFFVNFGEINNRGVDNRIKTFDNSTPFLDVYKPLNSGDSVAMYKTYTPGIDNNEYHAQNQSGWEQAINGLAKFQTTIGTVVLGNTLGFVNGLTEWAKTGNISSIGDNSFSRTFDDWNTTLSYQLPNYVTKDERDSTIFGKAFGKGAANFWANDVMNGLAFTFGTVASEAIWAWATGGMSLAARAGQWGAKIGQAGRFLTGAARVGEEVASVARVGEELASAGRFGKAFLGLEKSAEGLAKYKGFVYKALDNAVATGKMSKGLANGLAKTGEILNSTRFIATSSGNEAGIEAFHYKKEAMENFYDNFEKLNGRQPTSEEIADITDKIEGSANNVFMGNMAILGVSNLAMMGSMFNAKLPLGNLQAGINKKLFGIGVEKVAGSDVFTAIARKGWQKAAGLTYKIGSPIVREGLFEEGLQGVATKTANNWIERQYDPKYLNKVSSIYSDAWEAGKEQYGTKEGWTEIGIGGIVGILGGTVTGEFSRFKEMAEQQEKIVAPSLNAMDVTMSTLAEDITARRLTGMAKVMRSEDDAKNAKDAVTAKLAHHDGVIAMLEMHNDPLFNTDFKQLENHFSNMVSTTDVSEQEKEDVIEGFKALVKEYKEVDNFADSVIGSQGRIYGTNFQASHVKRAFTHAVLQGQTSKGIMDSSLEEMSSYMDTASTNIIKINNDLQALGRDKKQAVRVLAKEHNDLNIKSTNIQNKIQQEQMSVQEGRESKVPLLQRQLLEIEDRKSKIRTELEGISKEISQNKKTQLTIREKTSGIPMVDEFIAVDDLLNLDNRLKDIKSNYETLKKVNPISAKGIEDTMANYNKAKESLLKYNEVVKLIASGKFSPRIANDNPFSAIFNKFSKSDAKPEQHTGDLLNMLNSNWHNYKMGYVKTLQEKDVEKHTKILEDLAKVEGELTDAQKAQKAESESILKRLAEKPTEDKIKALQEELKTIEDDNNPRIAEIDKELTELEALLKPAEEVKNDDTPSRENVNAKKVEVLKAKLVDLQELLKNTPENVTVEQPITTTQLNIDEIKENSKLDNNAASRKLAEIAKTENVNLTELTREEYTDYAIKNGLKITDQELRNAPELRSPTTLEETMALRKSLRESLTDKTKDIWNKWTNSIEILASKSQKERYILDEVRVLSGTANSGSWLFFDINNSQVDSSQAPYKSYFSLKDFNKITPEQVVSFMKFLQEKGYKGGIKTFQDLESQGVLLNDQFVMHGDTESDAKLGEQLAKEFFKDEIKSTGLGKDGFENGKSKSYSQILSDRISESIDNIINGKVELTTEIPAQQPNLRIKEIQKEITAVKKEINSLQPTSELTPTEALEARIADILKLFKTSFIGTYDTDEALKNRPDQKDIDRYNELKNNPIIQNIELQKSFDTSLLSEKDKSIVDETMALKQKLSQWRVYDSLAEDEQSVADLLDLVAQLETEVEQETTVSEPNVEDTFEELKKTATVDILELSVNTNYPVTVKRETNGSYSITHMNPSSLLQRMGATNVKIGKKEVSFQEVDNQKKQGLVVDFTSGGVAMKFTISDRGRISIAEKDFKAIPNVKTIESLSSWTYPTLYEQDFEGNWKPISSDFSDPNITGDSNNLKDEDALELFIDVNNEYNQKLLRDKVKDEELENQVVIYIRKKGENYGTIKGLTQANRNELLGSEASIFTLRKLAAEALKEGKSGVVATTKVKYVQLGNPILNIDGNGRISQIAISNIGLKNIEATGFVQDGEITLNKEVKNVRRSFIKKISEKNKGKKVPIVVIKRGVQMIAFPVQMVKTTVSKIEDLNIILDDSTKTDAQKVTAINNLLIENGIAPKEFELTTLDEQKVNAIADRLDKNQEYKTAEQLADKNYKKENLINDVTIALDLINIKVSLPSQKFNIDLENLDYDNLPYLKVEKQEVLEKEAKKEVETPKVISAKKQVNKPKTAIEKEELKEITKISDVEEIAKTIVDSFVPIETDNEETNISITVESKGKPSNISQGQTFSVFDEELGIATQYTMTDKGMWEFGAGSKKYTTKETEFIDWMYEKSLNTFKTLRGKERQLKEQFVKKKELETTEEKIKCPK